MYIGKKIVFNDTDSTSTLLCAACFTGSPTHMCSSDDFLPALMYVIVRARLPHLGAEIRFIADFCPQIQGSGRVDMMFTMLKSAYYQICRERHTN
uniref:VPS9 domain-containing protein n=1 Tax=Strongyloides papillosus TaxID=174720 RepID=A0A0N5BAV3_STREA